MGTYILRRLLLMIPTLIGITFLVFMLIALSPGGIGAALAHAGGQTAGEATSAAIQRAYLEDRYGLNEPAIVQYFRWLERISPVKFGTRDQIAPNDETIRYPRAVAEPTAWRWFRDELPGVERQDFEFPPDADLDQRDRIYRAAANRYARSRAGYIAATTLLEQAIVAYARETGERAWIDRANELRVRALPDEPPSRDAAAWETIEQRAQDMFRTYEAAAGDREKLAAIFRAKPYPEAGFAIIPRLVSVAKPDLGVSFSRSQPVSSLIMAALPVTLLLNLIAFPIIYGIAIPSGMLAASRQGTWIDVGSGAFFLALYSIPVVWAGVLAVGYLASNEYLGAFPVAGLHSSNAGDFTFLPTRLDDGTWHRGYMLDTLWHICLPVACLVYTGFAVLSKQTRAAMLENFNADYVRTAKAKGVSNKDVVLKHVFRNSLLPLITIFVTLFPAMLSGSVVIERIFTVPGMGNLLIEAIHLRDRELILANTFIIAIVNLFALLLADILYALADPRISYD